MAALLLAAVAVFLALGAWQVERRAWKLALMDAIDRRIGMAAAPAPGPADWPSVSAEADAYRQVHVSGTLLDGDATLVQAVTELGPGSWLLTPLRTDDGWTVLVNRGFVPPDRRDHTRGPDGRVTIKGLLRISEPKGAFLQSNDPAHGRWFSRDTAAIASARKLGPVAPYFIDADATPNPGGVPVGGLTVVAFRNSHLIYAITWFALAALSGAGLWMLRADGGKGRA